MSIVSGVGLTSGIDYNQLITKLIAIQRRPIDLLKSNKSEYNDKISAYNTFSSKLSTLQDTVEKLKTSSDFYVKTASVSDETIIGATVSSSASQGLYTIEPHSVAGKIQLASVDRRTGTTSVASLTDSINSSGSAKVFEYTYAGTTRSLSIEDGATLENLRDAINNDSSNPGVTASIVNVGTSDYRLLLTGDDTGSTKTISITANTTLSGYTDSDFTSSTASDAKFRVGGVDITKSSNTVGDVIPGVTFSLKAESTSSVTITVNYDPDTIKDNIGDFVDAYNDIISYVSSNSQYDSTTHTGGAFTGESTPRRIVERLKSIISSRVTGLPENLRTLAQIGIATDYKTGQLTLDSSTLEQKLSTNIDDVANLFTDSTNGIATELYDYIDEVTDTTDGSITYRTKGLQSLVDNMSDDIDKLENRLTNTEEDLRTQFAALESLLTGMSSQSYYINSLYNYSS